MENIAPVNPDLQAESNLLDNINAGNMTAVKEFIKNYPMLRLCYGDRDVCALDFSIECRQLVIYAILKKNGFYTDRGEDLKRKIDNLPHSLKEKIRVENLKHVVRNPEAFIGIILSKCSFDPQSPVASSDVREMLFKFNVINEIKSMFPAIAHADFTTIFDYGNESVRNMDPNGDEFTLGLAYFSKGLLYVGKNDSKNQRYGTFAHEMTHFALYLIHENACLPYCKGDTAREAEWNEVVKKVKQQYLNNKETTDNIIKWVFELYEPGYEQSAELAVRVNDMLAFYHDNDEKIKELEVLHAELFSYIRKKVVPDFEIPNVYRMIKLNNEIGLIQEIEESELQVKSTESTEPLNFFDENGQKVCVLSSNVPKLTLSHIFNIIKNLSGNKLHIKAKNVFIDVKMLEQKHIKDEIYALLKEENTVFKLILHGNLDRNETFKSLNELVVVLNAVYIDIEYYIVVDRTDEEKFANNFVTKQVTQTWTDLTQETKDFIFEKKVNFRGSPTYKVSDFFSNTNESISDNILPLLCSEEEISVQCDVVYERKLYFIERKILRKFKVPKLKDGKIVDNYEYEELPLKDFIEKTKDDRIVLISDVAGSGKTTLLRRIQEILLFEHKASWISFVNLKSFVAEFKEGACVSFEQDMIKILKLDALHANIFNKKFKNGEVKILFDGFDEISPKCKPEVLEVFKNFYRSELNKKNQIFITTRTHLEDDLETNLHALGNKIQALDNKDQVKFLKEYWEGETSNLDSELTQECSKLLVNKISNIISTNTSLIGLPLIVQGLAQVYKNIFGDIKKFELFEKEIENLRILAVYEKIIDLNLDDLNRKHPELLRDIVKKGASFMKVFQFHAIAYLFNEELAKNLGLSYKIIEWPLEEIMRGGIVKFNTNGKLEFNHETYAEYLAALVAFGILEHKKKANEDELNFLMNILTVEKFQITRMFLNEMLEDFKPETFEMLSSGHFCTYVQKSENGEKVLCFSAFEGIFNLFTFFLKLIKDFDRELYVKVLLAKHQNHANFIQITNKTKNIENTKKLSIEFYSDPTTSQQLLQQE